VEVALAVAESVTIVPLAKLAEQVAGQLIPAGLLVTVPLPVPVSVTVRVKLEGGVPDPEPPQLEISNARIAAAATRNRCFPFAIPTPPMELMGPGLLGLDAALERTVPTTL
jgi:hypothetical protein